MDGLAELRRAYHFECGVCQYGDGLGWAGRVFTGMALLGWADDLWSSVDILRALSYYSRTSRGQNKQ